MPRPSPATQTRAVTPAPAASSSSEGGIRLSAINFALLAAGLACIVAGFVMLNAASTVAAPLLLVLGFVVLVPLGIIA